MPSDEDRIKSGLVSFIRRTLGAKIINSVDYLAHYPCKVVSQNSDGTLELIADDTRIGTLSNVPIRPGTPGIGATVPGGARCHVTWENGDPRKAVVVNWELGTVLTLKLGAGATHPLIFGDDFSTGGGAFDTLMQSIASAVGTSGTPAGATAAAASIVAAIVTYQLSVVSKLSTITKTA